MKRFCLIGEDVSHSKSHIIHREFLTAYNCSGSYDLMSVAPEDFDRAVERVKNLYDGFNVTRPYKERIINRLESIATGAAFRSVNTVKLAGDGSATGYSTDGAGFIRSLIDAGITPVGKKILVIGNGGAARAVAHALTAFDCHIYVYARNPESAKSFVALFKGRVGYMDVALKNQYDILINCTPVGQYPFINESPLPRAFIGGASLVFDTIYNPTETVLLSYAREEGAKCIGGRDMLIYQAYESQRIWQEKDLTQDELYGTINKIKKELNKK